MSEIQEQNDDIKKEIELLKATVDAINKTIITLSESQNEVIEAIQSIPRNQKDKDFIAYVEKTNTRYADISQSINELQSNIDKLKSQNSTSGIASNVDRIDGQVRMMNDSILTIRNHIEVTKLAFLSVVALFAVTLITTIFYNHSLSNDIEFVNRRTQRIMITQSLQVPDEETIWAPYLEEDELIEKIRGYHGALLKQQKTAKQPQQ